MSNDKPTPSTPVVPPRPDAPAPAPAAAPSAVKAKPDAGGKADAKQAKARAKAEKKARKKREARAAKEKARAEKARREAEKKRAKAEKKRARAEKEKAEADHARAELDKRRATSRKPGRLALPAEEDLRASLVGSFREILSYAEAQARRAPGDPTGAVHEFRKSLRRARSLVKLLDGVLAEETAETLQTTLRGAHRATSEVRDQHVMPDVLRRLHERAAKLADGDGAATPAAPALAAGETTNVDRLLEECARKIRPLPEVLATGLPEKVAWKDVRRGLRRTYRRARKNVGRKSERGVHTLRKRTKEVTYQLELFATAGGAKTARTRKRFARLSEELGQVVDLIMVRDHLRTKSTNGDAAAAKRLGRVLDHEIGKRARKARKRSKDLLDDPPKQFARATVKDTRAAHKLAQKK